MPGGPVIFLVLYHFQTILWLFWDFSAFRSSTLSTFLRAFGVEKKNIISKNSVWRLIFRLFSCAIILSFVILELGFFFTLPTICDVAVVNGSSNIFTNHQLEYSFRIMYNTCRDTYVVRYLNILFKRVKCRQNFR